MAPFWHRKPYFSILNLSVFHLADKFTNNSFLRVQKNPGNLTVPGYLTFGHMYLTVLNIYNLRCYAKIIR